MSAPQGDTPPRVDDVVSPPESRVDDVVSPLDDRPVDEHQDADDTDDTDDQGTRREKRYRIQLREAQGRVSELQQMLDRTRSGIIADIAKAQGVDSRLLTAAGYDTEGFINDDGDIDRAKVLEACADTAQQFNIARPRVGVQPNMQQGRGSGQPQGGTTWSQLVGDAARRGRA